MIGCGELLPLEWYQWQPSGAGFGLFDSCRQRENFFESRGVEHTENARRHAGERELDMLVPAIYFVIDDFAHAGGIHKGNAAEIEDGVAWRLGAAKERSQRRHAG